MSLITELKRRNVFRVGAAYVVGSWLLLQVLDVIGPMLRLPDTVARYTLFLLAVGIVPALVLAWAFEWTSQGVRREREGVRPDARSGTRVLDRAIMVTLALAVALLLYDRFRTAETGGDTGSGHSVPATPPAEVLEDPAFRQQTVAVLPFVALSSGPDDDYFADGLTVEIINALGQAPDLMVTARTSAFHFKGQNLPAADIARQLGVAHVVEGSVRRAGDRLRINAQLVRTEDGFQLWSDTYDRDAGDDFVVQAEIAEKVAQALDVLLDDGLRQRMRSVGTRNVDAFIAFQKGIERYEKAHQNPNQISLLRQANRAFDRAIELEPSLYAAYEYHTDLYTHILIANANGTLEGDVTAVDLEAAPVALRRDFERAIRHARTLSEQHSANLGLTLLFGPWRGLGPLAEKAAASPGCEAPVWLHLLGPVPGFGEPLLASFERMAACDPLRARPVVHIAGQKLWLGQADQAARLARRHLERIDHPLLARTLALALALSGDAQGAEAAVRRHLREEDLRLSGLALVAAIRGDAESAARYQDEYLGIVGSSDRESLIFEAVSGNRNEANRLARAIDGRPFGHLVLLQAVYLCFCGAPFDLEAVPEFSERLGESGLPWPPASRYDLPLKQG